MNSATRFISTASSLSSACNDWISDGHVRIDVVRQVLDDPDREQLLDLLIREQLLPEDVRRGLEHRARCAAVEEFKALLAGDHLESEWQRWFQRNDWVLGSDLVRVADERPIDVGHIADYLREGFDGFLDVVERDVFE